MPITPARAVCALALVWGSSTLQAQTAVPHWEYSGNQADPAHWGQLDPTYEGCAIGAYQSPIDITETVKVKLPPLQFHYSPAAPALMNNGHSLEVRLPAGQSLAVGDDTYQLQQLHFHSPGEESVAGRRAAMSAHLVHRDAKGEIGVVAVMIQTGAANPAYETLFAHLPRLAETVVVDDFQLDVSALLPASKGYYSYTGSLTTPPCTEGVNWIILKTPITLSEKQIAEFQQMFNDTARPLQPVNGRLIEESVD